MVILFVFQENVHHIRNFQVISNKNINTMWCSLETICHRTRFRCANLPLDNFFNSQLFKVILKQGSQVGNAIPVSFVSDFPTRFRIIIIALKKFQKCWKIKFKKIVYSKFPFDHTLRRVKTSHLLLYVGCIVFSWEGILIKLSLFL